MKGYEEYTLNKSVEENGGIVVTLESILLGIDEKKKKFSLNLKNSTIRYIEQEEYEQDVYSYIEPEFCESTHSLEQKTRFILFSAPGATGKSALAKHICYSKNGIYWDLPNNKVAEYSFQGVIAEAVGYKAMSEFIKSIVEGENFFVIDAFDEAEAGSGRSGIEFFLRDLNDVTKECECTCAVLMARTESALFIKNFFETNNVTYKHYEIGYFAECNSKQYIENRLKKFSIDISPVVSNCINEQFNEIHRIFHEDEAKAFLGYAPVLDALAASYVDERNTTNLLKHTTNGENNCRLMIKILELLLDREREKFVKALKSKFSELKVDIDTSKVYKRSEQLNRILGKLLFDDAEIFGEIDIAVPVEYQDEYLEVVNTQLPQHPFIFSKEREGCISYEFTGPAFRDYAIAFGLADEQIGDFVREFLSENRKYCASQMLVEFYETFSDKKIKGKDISLMYNSFKAHARMGESISLNISGDEDECYVEFSFSRNDNNDVTEFEMIDSAEGVFVNQISNCNIDFAGKVYVGNAYGEARINNSVIICEDLVWNCNQILLEAYSPGNCILVANKFSAFPNAVPRFEIKTDQKKNLKISANNINSYYKLLAYKEENIFEAEDADFDSFANIVRRIFSCLRSHSKDTPARKMDFIDNRIIGSSDKKRKVLNFLLDKKVLYTDEQDWLYKLDTDKVAQFAIMWNDVRSGDFASLRKLYDEYIKQ